MTDNNTLEDILHLCEETNKEVKRVFKLLEKFNLDKLDDDNDPPKTIFKKVGSKNINIKKSAEPIKKGNVIINIYNDTILLTGDTFDRKDTLKMKFAAKWHGPTKGWLISKNNLDTISEFCKTYFVSADTKTYQSNIDSNKIIKNSIDSDFENSVNDDSIGCMIDDD